MEELLDHVTLCNTLALRTTFSMAFLWALVAMPALAPAFIAPDDESQLNMTSFTSVQEEFSLIPGRIHPAELTSSIFFLGNFFLGQVPCVFADRIGRRPVLIATVFVFGLSGVLAAAAPTFTLLLVARFVQGANFSAMTMINWVICCESISIRSHAMAAVIFGIFWVLGYCVVAPLAILCSNWRQLQFLVSAPSLVFSIFIAWTLPESPAFLANKGRIADLKVWILETNRFSRKIIPEEEIDTVATSARGDSEKTLVESVRSIGKSETTMIYLFAQIFIWIADFMMYAAMALTSTGLASSEPYWSYVFSGLVELPCYIVIPFFLDWLGRRPSVIGIHLISAIVFALLIMCSDASIFWTPLWLIAKFGMASAFMCCFVYGAEIFPVDTRNICMGVCATLANLGAVLSPHLDILDEFIPGGAFAVFVFLCLAAAGVTTRLPETKRVSTKL